MLTIVTRPGSQFESLIVAPGWLARPSGLWDNYLAMVWLLLIVWVVFVRFMFWLMLALVTMTVMTLATVVWVAAALIGTFAPNAATGWHNTARSLWGATMACARATDAHRNWLLPNRPAAR